MPARKLGFAVKVLGERDPPSHDTRRWRSGPHLCVSLERLRRIFDYLARARIAMYRFSSSLVAYGTHPDLPQFHGQVEECAEELASLGEHARTLGLRLSSHPSQYIVLNSASPEVSRGAVRDVALQARLLDAMGLGPEAVVVLHVGSAEGGPDAGTERFLRALERLPEGARERLVIENDDRTFSLTDVVDISKRTGLRVVWDILHHHCHDPEGIPDREALRLALATWPAGQVPTIHYSSPKTALEERVRKRGRRRERQLVLPQLRAHADMVDPIVFEQFLRGPARRLSFDVMLEAKAKDAALLRLREQLAARGLPSEDGALRTP
jgi:UV DNA damage endonuclease